MSEVKMDAPSIPAGTSMANAAESNPASALVSSPPATGVHLRYRPKPGEEVVHTDVLAEPTFFWRQAREWDSRMRNRNRWIGDEKLRNEIADLSRKYLLEWQVDEATIVALARAAVVEVLEDQVPKPPAVSFGKLFGVFAGVVGGAVGVVGGMIDLVLPVLKSFFQRAMQRYPRRMPWESLLTMAVRKYQNHERLLVYRRIGGLDEHKKEFVTDNLKAAFVESAPGALWNVYDFTLEFKAIETYLNGLKVERQRNLSLSELEEYIKRNTPAVIHFSGIDGYQGFDILQNEAEDSVLAPGSENIPESTPAQLKQAAQPKEGAYFRNALGLPEVERPEAVASALCAGAKKPLLVTFNLYNSSARLAAETVRQGAAAAIGFQDFINDTVAEIFFANLFRFWSDGTGKPLLEAFNEAVVELDPYLDRVRGSGVTLWTSEPLLEDPEALRLPVSREEKAEGKSDGGPQRVDLEFDVKPYAALNYSVLHNGKSKMFETFRIYKFSADERTDLRVEVNLNVGGRDFPFRESFSMKHHILDLKEKIAVGLTSALTRSLRESVRTTIFVRITLGPNDECYCKTFDVSLLAVDEWIDDEPSGIFLPSFVLPRDPIIPVVIANAQRYLMALADDASQGFDGYQSCDDSGADPAAALEPQTRAIWYALQHDFAVKYINPPPTFTEDSQRLRTPSEVLKAGRGTCLDLALLLAACFEHIGLHPVIFLLRGHAFAGYWADQMRRKTFRTDKLDPIAAMTQGNPEAVSYLSKPKLEEELAAENILAPVEWKYDLRRRTEIQQAVRNGELVAIEATYLTNGGSFSSACDVGEDNLEAEEGFESMLDISLARDNDVTPLPLAVEAGA